MPQAIGLIELSSVASGFQVADTMLKAANVNLLLSRSICSGKYMVLVGGEVAGVQSAVDSGSAIAHGTLIDTFVIPNVHADVFQALGRSEVPNVGDALGVLESFSVASLIEGADAAAKAASVTLIEIRLAMALGGKAFVTMTGDVASVEAAIEAGAQLIGQRGLLVNSVVIPRPHQDVYKEVV
jgi:bacterial microcompartment shell protein